MPPANFFVFYEIDDDESKHALSLDEYPGTRRRRQPTHGYFWRRQVSKCCIVHDTVCSNRAVACTLYVSWRVVSARINLAGPQAQVLSHTALDSHKAQPEVLSGMRVTLAIHS